MTTINLQDGLEAWYEFDSDYFDSQRNVIEDQSGYGRHAEASGGPTIGVDGPNDFEAAGFDGADDLFSVPSYEIQGENSVVAIVNIPAYDSFNGIYEHTGGSGGAQIVLGSDDIRYQIKGGGSAPSAEWNAAPTDEWLIVVGRHTPDDSVQLFVNGDLKVHTETSVSMDSHNDSAIIGERGGDYLSGSISMVAEYSRALSDAEIEYLNTLTAPRRSRL